MTVTTVYAATSDGFAQSTASVTYATAYATAASVSTADGSNLFVGQRVSGGAYLCWLTYLDFDTSSIDDTDNVSAVVASLDGVFDLSTTDFTAQIRTYDWGGTLATDDWRTPTHFNALTLLATFASSGYGAGYNAFTETADFKNAINKTGVTSVVVGSDAYASATAPTTEERMGFEDAGTAGTTEDPKLDITHAAGGGGATGRSWYGKRGWY
jgi:hypothetical protein